MNEGVVFLCVANIDGVFAAALNLVGHIAHEVAGLPDGPAVAGLHLVDGKADALRAHRRKRGADVAGNSGKDGGAVVGFQRPWEKPPFGHEKTALTDGWRYLRLDMFAGLQAGADFVALAEIPLNCFRTIFF